MVDKFWTKVYINKTNHKQTTNKPQIYHKYTTNIPNNKGEVSGCKKMLILDQFHRRIFINI